MTIEEIKKNKIELEANIFKLIQDFQNKNLVYLDGIEIQTIEGVGEKKFFSIGVKVLISL